MIKKKRTETERKLKIHIKKVTAILMAVLLLPFSEVFAEETTVETEGLRVEKTTAEKNNSAMEELGQLVAKQWEEDYFAEMIVETGSGQIKVDGETDNIRDEFDLTVGEARQVVSSEEAIEEYFEKDVGGCYKTERIGSGRVQVTAPFQTRRLIVTGVRLRNTYDASDVITLSEYDTIVLQYDTEEQTKDAYDRITAIYGADACQPDRVYSSDQLLQETTEPGTYECTSWGTALMGMDDLKNQTRYQFGGREPYTFTNTATVAIIDTGVNKNSRFFAGRTITDNSSWFENVNNKIIMHSDVGENAGAKSIGHGTHVAGIIADSTPGNVELMVLKVFNESSDFATYLSICCALDCAVNAGADVINMSLGFSELNETELSEFSLMDQIIDSAFEKNIPICVAAGNDNANVSTCYPACNDKVLTVGAMDSLKERYAGSNYGEDVDFCAPGVNIQSASYNSNTGIVTKTGTSMASPHIAAASAYIKLLYPTATVEQVKNILKTFCMDLGTDGWDQYFGWGYPDLTALYQKASWTTYDVSGVTFTSQTRVYDGTKHMLIAGGQIPSGMKIFYSADGYISPGTYTIIAYLEGSVHRYRTIGTRTAVLTILAAKTSTPTVQTISKVKSFKVKQKSACTVQVQWKKNSQASGYQIQYSLKKNFKTKKTIRVKKAKKTKYVLKKLKKGRTYYFKIRAYKMVRGQTVYSSWSSKKKIKIK